jgi:hypothetical protein
MKSLEDQYKRETGKDALHFINHGFIITEHFIDWLKSKYEAEHTRRVAAEERLQALGNYMFNSSSDNGTIAIKAIIKHLQSVQSMEGVDE